MNPTTISIKVPVLVAENIYNMANERFENQVYTNRKKQREDDMFLSLFQQALAVAYEGAK